MPVPQLLCGGPDGVEGGDGIDQVIDIPRMAVQVLGEQLQPEVAGEDPGPVALPRPDRSAPGGRARQSITAQESSLS